MYIHPELGLRQFGTRLLEHTALRGIETFIVHLQTGYSAPHHEEAMVQFSNLFLVNFKWRCEKQSCGKMRV